jgi:hypothetical protein
VVIQVNLKKDNGPFMVYDCPDFEAKANIQMRAFYIVLRIDHRFVELDDNTNFYSARVVGTHQIQFKVPAWPFPLFPHPKNQHSDKFWRALTDQVPRSVRNEMTNVHSVFDGDNMETAASAGAIEARKWSTMTLDFTKVKGVGQLSSSAVYADAGKMEALDFDYIELPVYRYDDSTKKHSKIDEEHFLGFKVGVLAPDGEGSRKVGRSAAPKSKLALKREEAAAARKGTDVKMEATDDDL